MEVNWLRGCIGLVIISCVLMPCVCTLQPHATLQINKTKMGISMTLHVNIIYKKYWILEI